MSCFCVQDLLQLQYEGVAVMKMFDKAKVNVNLLIFLLNKKFYGKWRQWEKARGEEGTDSVCLHFTARQNSSITRNGAGQFFFL